MILTVHYLFPQPDEAITDDFLFPMTSRLSYASSPESDLDISIDSRSMTLRDSNIQNDRRLVKSSSDPSITAAEELADIKNFNQYPSYTLGRNSQVSSYCCGFNVACKVLLHNLIFSLVDLSSHFFSFCSLLTLYDSLV